MDIFKLRKDGKKPLKDSKEFLKDGKIDKVGILLSIVREYYFDLEEKGHSTIKPQEVIQSIKLIHTIENSESAVKSDEDDII